MIKNNFQYVFNKVFKIYYTIKEIFQFYTSVLYSFILSFYKKNSFSFFNFLLI